MEIGSSYSNFVARRDGWSRPLPLGAPRPMIFKLRNIAWHSLFYRPSIFETEKLVIRKTGDRLICSYDDNNYYFDTLVHGIYKCNPQYDLKFFLAILNSNPGTYFYRCLHDIKGKVFAKISLDDLSNFPVPTIDNSNKKLSEEIISYANNILSSTKQLQDKRNRFLRRLKDNFQEIKITGALSTFDQLEFADFLKELKKQKIITRWRN